MASGFCEWRCVRIDELLPDAAAYESAYALLPEWRRRKAEAFRFEADRRRSVAAWMLLRQLLAEKGLDADALKVTENEFGRPEFDSSVGISFSISHSGERVMAAVAEGPVGCDVEEIAPLRAGVAEAVLTDEELKMLTAFPEGPERDRAFIRLWVRKESCAKARGLGLSLDPKSFSVLSGDSPCTFRDFDFSDGYLGCVCTLIDGMVSDGVLGGVAQLKVRQDWF